MDVCKGCERQIFHQAILLVALEVMEEHKRYPSGKVLHIIYANTSRNCAMKTRGNYICYQKTTKLVRRKNFIALPHILHSRLCASYD